jgi:hypothetical protein
MYRLPTAHPKLPLPLQVMAILRLVLALSLLTATGGAYTRRRLLRYGHCCNAMIYVFTQASGTRGNMHRLPQILGEAIRGRENAPDDMFCVTLQAGRPCQRDHDTPAL